MKGKVKTVLGLVSPDELGNTLTHEHLLHSLKKEVFRRPFPSFKYQQSGNTSIQLRNLGWIRQYPYSFDFNIEFNDDSVVDAVTRELEVFKSSGGGTIVENSSWGLRAENHVAVLKKLSHDSGVKIIMGTGFYVADSLSTTVLNYSCEVIENIMREELLTNVLETNASAQCGVIGEIGCSYPLAKFEKQVIASSGSVQEQLGCPVIIHPGRSKKSPGEILRIFQENGGSTSHTVMSHLDRTITDLQELAEFASSGCYCEFDLFGNEVSHYQLDEDVDMPSDAERIARILFLVSEGYENKILISHDIHTKHRLMDFGGHGYSHILLNVVPKMLKRGISKEVVEKILVTNPKNWLTFFK